MVDSRAETAPVEMSAWVRMPRQERARRSFERVLAAGAELLIEQGYEGFSMSEVCRRASLSPGALYDRVDGKDMLFLAIHQRELNRIAADAETRFAQSPRWTAMPTSELVTETIRELALHFLREQTLLRVFILRAAVDDRVRDEGSHISRRTSDAVIALLLTRTEDYPHPKPETAVHTAFRLAFETLSWRTAFGFDFAESDVDTPERWIDQLIMVTRSYLMTAPG